MSASALPTRLTPAATESMRALKVLIVDDSPMALEIAERWFRRQGCAVVDAAPLGASGLATHQRVRHDVLLLDLDLPDLSGLDLAARVRSLGGPRPWIVLFTAVGDEHVKEATRAGHFDGVLRKPCLSSDYAQTMQRALHGLGRAPAPELRRAVEPARYVLEHF